MKFKYADNTPIISLHPLWQVVEWTCTNTPDCDSSEDMQEHQLNQIARAFGKLVEHLHSSGHLCDHFVLSLVDTKLYTCVETAKPSTIVTELVEALAELEKLVSVVAPKYTDSTVMSNARIVIAKAIGE